MDAEGREGEAVTALVLAGGIGLIFLSLFLVLGAVGGLTKEAGGVGRSLQVLEAMTSLPDDMRAEQDASFADRVLLPLLGRAQGLGRRMSPADAHLRVREKLELLERRAANDRLREIENAYSYLRSLLRDDGMPECRGVEDSAGRTSAPPLPPAGRNRRRS